MQETAVNSTTAEQATTVLVVEDDEGLNHLIRKTLAKQGYKTYQALSGAEALHFLAKDSNVILLLDYILPDMNGKQVIRAIKEENMDVPLIIMTGRGDEAVAIDMMKMGVRDYIIKHPGYIENLPNIIQRIKNEIDTEKELARAEKALRESEERFKRLFEESPSGIAMMDTKGVLREANRSLLKLLDLSKEELIGKNFADLAAGFGLNTQEQLADFRERLGGGTPVNELTFLNREGKQKTIGVQSSTIMGDGQVSGVLFIVNDITGRKRAEVVLKESEAKYRALFEGCADGILIADIETKQFKYANKAFCDMLGYNLKEVLSLGIMDIHPKQDLPHVISEFEAQARGEKTLATEIPCVKKDGSIIYMDINTTGIIIDGRECNVGFFRDITDRKRAEEEKLKLQSQLYQSQKMEMLGQLTGGIAHDFNNILGGIVGYADVLMLRFGNEPDLMKYAEKIKAAGLKASNHTRSLLTFARRSPLENKPVDMHNSISHVIDILQNTIDKRVEIQCSLNAQKHGIKGNAGLIENMFLNICINARDAMPQGGTISIETKTVLLNERSFEGRPFKAVPGEYIHISITDTGVGMDKNTQQHLFEPFFTTKEQGKGTGLGLASVYGTVKQHGGYITVISGEGKGATFDVYLPVLEKSEDLQSQKEDKGIIKGSGNILLIDDEPQIREAVSDLLRSIGYTVACCNNGMEAVEYYSTRHKEIDAVIIDMIMPQMSGPDCFRRLKEINPSIIAIVASGYWEKEEVELVVKEGIKTLLKKPFSINQLSCALADVLKK